MSVINAKNSEMTCYEIKLNKQDYIVGRLISATPMDNLIKQPRHWNLFLKAFHSVKGRCLDYVDHRSISIDALRVKMLSFISSSVLYHIGVPLRVYKSSLAKFTIERKV